jgi:predicted transcriptional regulator
MKIEKDEVKKIDTDEIEGDEYLKVSRSLLKSEDATDEEIASSTGLRINMVRRVLYDLFGKGLITGIRVKDERKGWFVYRWRSRRDAKQNVEKNMLGAPFDPKAVDEEHKLQEEWRRENIKYQRELGDATKLDERWEDVSDEDKEEWK